MSTPRRIQRRRTSGWRMPEGAVYVGRPSRWGNPFRIYGGSLIGPSWSRTRGTWTHIPADYCWHLYVSSSPGQTDVNAVAQFRTLLQVRQEQEPERLRAWLHPLRGRDLVCWCSLDQPCHADMLLEVANPNADDPPPIAAGGGPARGEALAVDEVGPRGGRGRAFPAVPGPSPQNDVAERPGAAERGDV